MICSTKKVIKCKVATNLMECIALNEILRPRWHGCLKEIAFMNKEVVPLLTRLFKSYLLFLFMNSRLAQGYNSDTAILVSCRDKI